MGSNIQDLRDEVIRHRRKLRALEAKRAGYGEQVPSHLWQELVEASHQLEKAERAAKQAGHQIVKQVNRTRESILEKLSEYNSWRLQMHEMERTFLTNIVRPGYRLREAVRTREFLEGEYQRIRKRIASEHYPDLEALKADIHAVLMEVAEVDDFNQVGDDEQVPNLNRLQELRDLDLDKLVDEFEREHVVREFKRTVLPAVHPDTSDEDEDTFQIVYEVYENRDYLLMQAYTLQYRGPVEPEEGVEGLEFLDEVVSLQEEYQVVNKRLVKRVSKLKRDLTPRELADPEELQADLLRQREEILERIQHEAERILELRDRIEGLVQDYLNKSGEKEK